MALHARELARCATAALARQLQVCARPSQVCQSMRTLSVTALRGISYSSSLTSGVRPPSTRLTGQGKNLRGAQVGSQTDIERLRIKLPAAITTSSHLGVLAKNPPKGYRKSAKQPKKVKINDVGSDALGSKKTPLTEEFLEKHAESKTKRKEAARTKKPSAGKFPKSRQHQDKVNVEPSLLKPMSKLSRDINQWFSEVMEHLAKAENAAPTSGAQKLSTSPKKQQRVNKSQRKSRSEEPIQNNRDKLAEKNGRNIEDFSLSARKDHAKVFGDKVEQVFPKGDKHKSNMFRSLMTSNPERPLRREPISRTGERKLESQLAALNSELSRYNVEGNKGKQEAVNNAVVSRGHKGSLGDDKTNIMEIKPSLVENTEKNGAQLASAAGWFPYGKLPESLPEIHGNQGRNNSGGRAKLKLPLKSSAASAAAGSEILSGSRHELVSKAMSSGEIASNSSKANKQNSWEKGKGFILLNNKDKEKEALERQTWLKKTQSAKTSSGSENHSFVLVDSENVSGVSSPTSATKKNILLSDNPHQAAVQRTNVKQQTGKPSGTQNVLSTSADMEGDGFNILAEEKENTARQNSKVKAGSSDVTTRFPTVEAETNRWVNLVQQKLLEIQRAKMVLPESADVKKLQLRRGADEDQDVKKLQFRRGADEDQDVKKLQFRRGADEDQDVKKLQFRRGADEDQDVKKLQFRRGADEDQDVKKLQFRRGADEDQDVKKLQFRRGADDNQDVKKLQFRRGADEDQDVKKLQLRRGADDNQDVKKLQFRRGADDNQDVKKLQFRRGADDNQDVKKLTKQDIRGAERDQARGAKSGSNTNIETRPEIPIKRDEVPENTKPSPPTGPRNPDLEKAKDSISEPNPSENPDAEYERRIGQFINSSMGYEEVGDPSRNSKFFGPLTREQNDLLEWMRKTGNSGHLRSSANHPYLQSAGETKPVSINELKPEIKLASDKERAQKFPDRKSEPTLYVKPEEISTVKKSRPTSTTLTERLNVVQDVVNHDINGKPQRLTRNIRAVSETSSKEKRLLQNEPTSTSNQKPSRESKSDHTLLMFEKADNSLKKETKSNSKKAKFSQHLNNTEQSDNQILTSFQYEYLKMQQDKLTRSLQAKSPEETAKQPVKEETIIPAIYSASPAQGVAKEKRAGQPPAAPKKQKSSFATTESSTNETVSVSRKPDNIRREQRKSPIESSSSNDLGPFEAWVQSMEDWRTGAPVKPSAALGSTNKDEVWNIENLKSTKPNLDKGINAKQKTEPKSKKKKKYFRFEEKVLPGVATNISQDTCASSATKQRDTTGPLNEAASRSEKIPIKLNTVSQSDQLYNLIRESAQPRSGMPIASLIAPPGRKSKVLTQAGLGTVISNSTGLVDPSRLPKLGNLFNSFDGFIAMEAIPVPDAKTTASAQITAITKESDCPPVNGSLSSGDGLTESDLRASLAKEREAASIAARKKLIEEYEKNIVKYERGLEMYRSRLRRVKQSMADQKRMTPESDNPRRHTDL
ncbi:hypothetical protein RRG08_018332 [Elysia crispata]|uniref:Uncharacterized protein n=1 Tax=Elysia crispata TaxID=231223 RepID=A0AAE1AVU1_9GAST|nr:hypothetical protein RRG08_018332 [Elysia crispata]